VTFPPTTLPKGSPRPVLAVLQVLSPSWLNGKRPTACCLDYRSRASIWPPISLGTLTEPAHSSSPFPRIDPSSLQRALKRFGHHPNALLHPRLRVPILSPTFLYDSSVRNPRFGTPLSTLLTDVIGLFAPVILTVPMNRIPEVFPFLPLTATFHPN